MPFANKIVCGDCGGWYGRKTWHSTTYRDTVWQYNNKKDGHTKCHCRHIYAEELDAAIRKSMRTIDLTCFFPMLINDFLCFTNVKKLCTI
ncbi:MAG: zinc ribbon domain-containing protein [Oscillospiraceae bacterium]